MSPSPPRPSCKRRLTPRFPLPRHPGWGLRRRALECGNDDDGGGGDGDDAGFSSGSPNVRPADGGRRTLADNPEQKKNIYIYINHVFVFLL